MDKPQEKKVLGILAIVFGGIGLVFSWVPIVNNVAAFFAFVGLILGIIAIIRNRKAKKILALIGTILSAVAIIIVLATQSMYSSAIDSVSKDASSSSSSSAKSSSASEPTTYKAGDTIKQKDGMEIKINSVNYSSGEDYNDPDSGKQFVIVNVTLTNTGSKTLDYNPYDYKLSDNGNNVDFDSYLTSVTDELHSGTLSPNATVTGSLVGQATVGSSLKLVSFNEITNKAHWSIDLQ